MAFTIRNRSKDKIFIVSNPAHQITACKLPPNRQVLTTLFYNLRTVKLNLRDSARITIQEVLIFWGKARIPTKHVKDGITKLEKLNAEWRNVQKSKNKPSDFPKNKLKEFATKLDDIFDISHQDAVAMMKSEEDKEFLLKQRERGGPDCMLGVDLKFARAAKINQQTQCECLFDIETGDEEDEDENGDEEENTCDEDFEDVLQMGVCTFQEPEERPEPSHIKRLKRGVREILTMKLSLLLDRCKVYDRNVTRMLKGTIEALGENPDDFKVSKTTIHEKQKEFRQKYTEKFLERINITEEEAVLVHWDGKLLKYL